MAFHNKFRTIIIYLSCMANTLDLEKPVLILIIAITRIKEKTREITSMKKVRKCKLNHYHKIW